MRFILSAAFWIAAVSLFMPDMDQRDHLIPEIRLANMLEETKPVGDQGVCERMESLCDAAAESGVLLDMAGAAGRAALDRIAKAYETSQAEPSDHTG